MPFILNDLHVAVLRVYRDNCGIVPPTYKEVSEQITFTRAGKTRHPSTSAVKQHIDTLCAAGYLDRLAPAPDARFATRNVAITMKGTAYLENLDSSESSAAGRPRAIVRQSERAATHRSYISDPDRTG